jgi:hypothetical protein
MPNASWMLRLPRDLKQQVEDAARKDNRSAVNFVAHVLRNEVFKRQLAAGRTDQPRAV